MLDRAATSGSWVQFKHPQVIKLTRQTSALQGKLKFRDVKFKTPSFKFAPAICPWHRKQVGLVNSCIDLGPNIGNQEQNK